MTQKISTGPNARPRDETIAQTAAGLPNDSSGQIEVSDEEIARVEDKLKAKDAPDKERRK